MANLSLHKKRDTSLQAVILQHKDRGEQRFLPLSLAQRAPGQHSTSTLLILLLLMGIVPCCGFISLWFGWLVFPAMKKFLPTLDSNSVVNFLKKIRSLKSLLRDFPFPIAGWLRGKRNTPNQRPKRLPLNKPEIAQPFPSPELPPPVFMEQALAKLNCSCVTQFRSSFGPIPVHRPPANWPCP